ncbi:uncharacterized protein LOC106085151 [Stomoxys calcitrans]|uniref:Uncharacterized protein n=1 Tax=Stomoxys calcitrans TaxID=35570 RepID=A0A1I8P875_STOCA|nr:uncharacterized protein LOC106085151 [Stomoxys calcitrans]
MSGKLIMKRKMDKHQTQTTATSSSSSSPLPAQAPVDEVDSEKLDPTQQKVSNEMEDCRNINDCNDNSCSTSTLQPLSKRLRCDTPPPEPEDVLHQHIVVEPNNEDFANNQRNRQLLEAIQAKMLELQQELDDFEEDFDEFYDPQPAAPIDQNIMSDEDARALGYAMCAQETILFLQREGISPESLLYTRLRDALVGRETNDHVFKT